MAHVRGKCKVDGCESKVFVISRQLCRLHYQRFWNGKPMDRVVIVKTTREVFDGAYKINPNGCWIWTRAKDRNGYGLLTRGPKTYRVHRLSWELHRSQIPKGMMVCHKCDVPSCVNPDHLFLGSGFDNSMDMMRKGRWAGSPTTKLTPAQVKAMRESYTGRRGQISALARQLGIGSAQAGKILKNECWRNSDEELLAEVNKALEEI